jgi:phosphoglycolate phosphatase-like HAD superfamily hydrolase
VTETPDDVDTVVLDVDGTLVDTVYQHTVLWAQAFAEVGVDVPMWKLHRAVGMGGDRFVTEVAGEEVEKQHGDTVRRVHDQRFDRLIDAIRPLPGASALLEELDRRGLKVVLASSGIKSQTERLITIVGGDEKSQGWTSSDDVESSKPAPDLIEAAIEKVDGSRSVVVGDAVWDVQAAEKAGLYSIGLLCGGFGEDELRRAGAGLVFETPQDLLDHLDETPLHPRRGR